MPLPAVHLFSALPAGSAGQGPEWVHLIPAGTFSGADGRGPYTLHNPEAVITASIAAGKLPIDENHAIDLAAPKGGPSPARGWIVELQSRTDGLWGKVEWTDAGKQLLADRAYRGFSPAFIPDHGGRVTRLLRASLVNDPNLKSLKTLHQRSDEMELLAQLRQILGLAEGADAAAVIAAVNALKGKTAEDPALQARLGAIAKAAGLKEDAEAGVVLNAVTAAAQLPAQMKSIAKAAGLKEDADGTAVLNAVTTLAKGAGDQAQAVVQLQSELAGVTTQLNTLRTDRASERATAFVDGAIKAGRVGVKPLRDHYIAMHAADPARVEKEIGAMPILGSGGVINPAPRTDGKVELNADQSSVVALMGLDPDKYRKNLSADAA